YDDGAALVAATDRLLTELRRLPGVVAAGVTTSIPFGQRYNDNVLLAEGHHMSPGESLMSVNQVTAGDGYFQAMGARLLTGRFLDERDGRATSRAIVIDDRLAKRFWPGQVAIGKRVYFPARLDDLTAAPPEDQWFTVVGVVAAMRLQGIAQDGDAGIFGTYFLSYRQFPQRQITFAIRTTNDPSSSAGPVRSIIREFDTNLALYDVRPMEALIDRVLMNRRTPMLLVLAFATVALLLCALGLYGVVAYEVKQRTREIAIRMAVGADRARIVRMVLRQGAAVVGMGIGVGLVGVVLAQDALRALLFEVTPLEPTVLGGIVAVVIGVGALACGVPASAAAATEPASALVSE
ncbi:MAG: FtsX-like permease family protein, partial [Vicinamibacterales bacterium]